MIWSLDEIRQLDRADPLASRRELFRLPEGLLYFDGNSLGPVPLASRRHIKTVVDEQWGESLIRSWVDHDWIGLSRQVGAKIAPLVGAQTHEVVATDSTSVNLFKGLAAATDLRPGRSVILMDDGQFPTDLYMAQGLSRRAENLRLCRVPRGDLLSALDEQVAVVCLSHVDYRTGERLDMSHWTASAHAQGALIMWDLSHSAGALDIDLRGCGVDFAVGCGYKFLNGGPGAPAFLFIAEALQAEAQTPLAGWLGHQNPFTFDTTYLPAPGIDRFQCGTPPILSLAALDAALEVFDGVDFGELRHKSQALGDLFLDLIEQRGAEWGLSIACPRQAKARGSMVSFRHTEGYAVIQALIERQVIGDFRVPDVLRFGITPLYQRYEDVWQAVDILGEVMTTEVFRAPRFQPKKAVT